MSFLAEGGLVFFASLIASRMLSCFAFQSPFFVLMSTSTSWKVEKWKQNCAPSSWEVHRCSFPRYEWNPNWPLWLQATGGSSQTAVRTKRTLNCSASVPSSRLSRTSKGFTSFAEVFAQISWGENNHRQLKRRNPFEPVVGWDFEEELWLSRLALCVATWSSASSPSPWSSSSSSSLHHHQHHYEAQPRMSTWC